MLQVIYDKSGRVRIKDVPAPQIDDHEVLVKNAFSVLSAGTEKSMLNLMKKPLWKMAVDRPDLAGQVIRFAKGAGVKKTMELVKSRLDVWHLLGYSSAGTVVQAGSKVRNIGIGDRVACIGSGFANHAEYAAVPKTLVCKIPKGVMLEEAAFTGIACIALQSIRQLKPQLGENIVVVGLGLIGQMTAQMLRANGCRVIGIDLDRSKTQKGYIDEGIFSDSIKGVLKATEGVGADGVIIAAASKHNLVNDAFDMCRKKGRVVLLGVCNTNIDREKMFSKELDFKISTSFGAGAFDINYEDLGKDYPLEYVRWTSERNMKAVLGLMAAKKLDLSQMTKEIYEINDAKKAYDELNKGKIITALFRYSPKELQNTIETSAEIKEGKVNVAIIGAGQFVKGFLISAIKKQKELSLYAIATKKGSNAKKLADEHKAKIASTSYMDILNDKNVSLVIIGTRHDSHAKIATAALRAGKHVFSEKPMAINEKEFSELADEIRRSGKTYTCGFNRRYSPAMKKIKENLSDSKPMMINYVFNNTYLPEDHWVNIPEVGGGRVIGEACHIIDLFSFLTGSAPSVIKAQKIASCGKGQSNDDNNISAVIKYRDGSVCTLTYSCIGNSSVQRERCTIIQDGDVIELDGYGTAKKNSRIIYKGKVDEGYNQEIEELCKKITGKQNSLAAAQSCIETTRAVFEIIRSMKGQKSRLSQQEK